MLAIGCWSWRWTPEDWRAVDAAAIRMLRMMAHIPRKAEELWVEGHFRSRRYCQTWLLLGGGPPWGTKVLILATKQWDVWARLDTNCALARAVHLHSRLYSRRTKQLARHTGLATTMGRGRRGQHLGRWNHFLVAAWGENWLSIGRDPARPIDMMMQDREPGPPEDELG